MASVASQLIEEVTAHAQNDISRMREIYAQTVLAFRITYVYCLNITRNRRFNGVPRYLEFSTS